MLKDILKKYKFKDYETLVKLLYESDKIDSEVEELWYI